MADDAYRMPAAPALRALLFESDQPSREMSALDVGQWSELRDNQLLWVDAVVPDGQPVEACSGGPDPALLVPGDGGALGLRITPDWTYVHVRALCYHDSREVKDVPVALAIGANAVITVHREAVDFISGVLDNEADHLRVGRMDAMSFAAALLDRMLTDYLDARDEFESKLDKLELQILRQPRESYLGELQALRHAASRLRRHLADQRDLFDALGRPDFDPRLSDAAQRHARALSARYSKVVGSMEAARELVKGSFELYTSRAAESTNQAMQTLTVVTVVMGVAATLAGILGMNFESPLFDSGERGFVIAAAMIGAIVLGALAWAAQRVWRSTRPLPKPKPTSRS